MGRSSTIFASSKPNAWSTCSTPHPPEPRLRSALARPLPKWPPRISPWPDPARPSAKGATRRMSMDIATITPVRLGISSCLLGQEVRFDGGHKRDAFLVEVFGRYVEWVPVCPEVEMGLGVPRETMRLESHGGEVRLITPKTGADHTDRLRTFAD